MRKFFYFYKRYLQLVKERRLVHILGMLFSLCLLFVGNYVFFQIGSVIDGLAEGQRVLGEDIYLLIALMFAPLFFEFIAFFLKALVFAHGMEKGIKEVYKNIIRLDVGFHINRATGKLISKVIATDRLIYAYTWDIEWFLLDAIASVLIPIALMYSISPEITLYTGSAFVVAIPLLSIAIKHNIKMRIRLKDAEYNRTTTIVDGLSNFETVRSFGSEDLEMQMFNKFNEAATKARWGYQMSFRVTDTLVRVVSIIFFFAGATPAWLLFQQGRITVGDVAIVLTFLVQLSTVLFRTFLSIRNLVKEQPVFEDVLELMDKEPSILEAQNPTEFAVIKGKLEIKNVTFAYEDSPKILQDLTLKIDPNQTIALVGPSGGGKSTIVRLLMRYYDPLSGDVLIDGVNVKELSYDSLRDVFGVVPQEPVLFNNTIAYNIGYALNLTDGIDKKEMEQIIEAAKHAQIHEFIQSLPKKYKTKVGERGLKLSGGQKQRVAIARVLIKDPKVVIFDEATSMLDSESEKAIQKAFSELSRDKTTIIIAHRLSTITHADKIIVIDQGKVVEEGTHEQLLQKDGLYKGLWDIQSGGFRKGT